MGFEFVARVFVFFFSVVQGFLGLPRFSVASLLQLLQGHVSSVAFRQWRPGGKEGAGGKKF